MESEEANEGDAEVHLTATAVDQGGDREDFGLVRLDDADSFGSSAAEGDDVLDDEAPLAGCEGEASSEDEAAIFFLGEDEPGAELAGDFLADDQPSEGRGNDGLGGEGMEAVGEGVS